ncbi:MAG: gliding motility-associated C-terminal domain-containing protein [Saprospiraceae bacterium]|nr:gliding motility-associated C-terminal domain-containing protein [Saprospiraceae bacterium]
MSRHITGFLLFIFVVVRATAQCPITVSAGPDEVRCSSPASVPLSGSITGSYLGFTWSPTTGMTGSTTLNPTVNATQTTNYVLTATALDASINLIDNGDFELGVGGFSSDYINNPGDLWPEGVFDVLTNPNAAHPNFPACGDHTTGSGNMMAVNGSNIAGVDVWCQTVTVSPNTQYVFTAWATALVASSPARLQFSINGVNLGTIFNVSSQTCVWQNFYALWNSGPSTSATICIVNQNTAVSGNDFALDDIVFSPTCRVSDTVRVEVVNIKAMAAVSSVFLPCQGASATLNGTGSSVGPGIMYNWQTLDGNIVSGGNTLNPVINSPGSYTLRVSFQTASGVICEKFATVNVFYATNPLTAIIVPPPQLGCGVASVTMVGNATPSIANVTWQWSVVTTGHIVGSSTTKNCIVNQPGVYQLLVTNTLTGCTSTAQMTVTAEAALPVAQASADTITCVQSTAVLSGAGSTMGAGITYLWSTTNGTIVSGQNSQNAEAGTVGTYILRVTNTANGCIVRDTVVVTENKILPFAAIDPPESIDCDSDTIELFVNLSPPPFVLLVWTASDGGDIASGEYTPNPKVTAPGTYILHTTDPLNGCVSIDTVAVITNYAPPTAATLPADSLTCQQTSVVLSGTGSSLGFNYAYQWSAAAGGNIVMGDQSLSPEVNAPGMYTLTVLNYFNGCTATSNVFVTADTNAVTAVAHVTDTLTCAVLSISLNTTGSSSGTALSYAWATTDGQILSGADTPTPLVSAQGIYELTLTNTLNGCSASNQVEVLQDTLAPAVLVTAPAQLTCALPVQSIVSAPLVPTANYNYAWTAGAGGNIISDTTAAGININAAGTYFLVVSNPQNGCSSMYSTSATQEAGIPVVLVGSPGPITCADTAQYLVSTGSSTGPEYVYSWLAANNGNIVSGDAGPSPLIDAAGTYILQIINQNNGCKAADSVAVAANTVAPPAIAGQGTLLTCAVPVSELNANKNLPSAQLNFHWSTVEGHFTTGQNSATTECDAIGTYYLMVTDSINGCTSLDSLEITENKQSPALSVLPPFPLTCAVTNVSLSATATGSTALLPLFHWNTANGNILNGDSTANPLIDAPGNYALTVTDPANGCSSTGGAIVFQNTTPPPIQVMPAGTITCAVTEQTLLGQNQSAGGNFSYLWTSSGGGQITAGDSTLLPTVNAAGMYLLTATNLVNGCKATDSVEVVQNTTPPAVDAGLSDTLNCLNNSLIINGSASGQGALVFLWTASTGHITQGYNSLSPTVDMPGSYTLMVTDQVNGCSALDSVSVFQDANIPVADAGQNDTLNCLVNQTTLLATASTGPGYQYLWTTNGGNIVSDPAVLQAVVNAPGMYRLAVTNVANGCARQDSVEVLENLNAPALQLSTPALLTCSTLSLQLSAQTPVPGGAFIWSTPNGNIVTGGNTANPTIDLPGMYSTTATDPVNGCTSTDSIEVLSDTNPPVIAVATPALLTCTVTEIPVTGTVSQPAANFSVQWTTIGGTFVSGQNSTTPQVSAPGTYQMNVLNQVNGCTAFVSVVVNENVNLPTAVASSAQQITCDSTTVAISAAGSSSGTGISYNWSGQGIVSGATTAAPVVSATGPYTLTVTNAANGCTASATATVTANTTPPTISFATPPALTCVRDSVMIDAGASSHGAAFQANWSTTNGHFLSGQNTLAPLVDAPAPYVLTLENTINGCISTQTIQVAQNIAAPGASIAPAQELHCNRQQVALSGSSTVPNVGFAWSSSNGQITAGASSATPMIAAPGTYSMLVTNPANGCTSAAQVTVAEVLPPEFTPVIWQPDCHTMTGAVDFGSVIGGKAPFRYSINGGDSYQSGGSFDAMTPGIYELVVEDDYGCTSIETWEIETPFFPELALDAVSLIALGDSVQLIPELNMPENFVASWEWTPVGGLSCPDCSSPFARPIETITYTLTIKDLNGCIAQARTLLRVNTNRVLYPPNVISPNGDGKNDFFNLFGKGVKDIQWMRIYDRWGSQLYDVEHLPINDEMQGWDGVFRGQPVSPGVFIWQAKVEFIDGVTELFSGDITVIR